MDSSTHSALADTSLNIYLQLIVHGNKVSGLFLNSAMGLLSPLALSYVARTGSAEPIQPSRHGCSKLAESAAQDEPREVDIAFYAQRSTEY
jgi:hypothetical protein